MPHQRQWRESSSWLTQSGTNHFVVNLDAGLPPLPPAADHPDRPSTSAACNFHLDQFHNRFGGNPSQVLQIRLRVLVPPLVEQTSSAASWIGTSMRFQTWRTESTFAGSAAMLEIDLFIEHYQIIYPWRPANSTSSCLASCDASPQTAARISGSSSRSPPSARWYETRLSSLGFLLGSIVIVRGPFLITVQVACA